MSEVTDPNDPRLHKTKPNGQQEAYLVKPDVGSVTRPYRTDYLHSKCGVVTSMRNSPSICRTYQSDPKFYSHTFCVGCGDHLPVGEFTWVDDGEVVGS